MTDKLEKRPNSNRMEYSTLETEMEDDIDYMDDSSLSQSMGNVPKTIMVTSKGGPKPNFEKDNSCMGCKT